tara:strand:- start:228 stop:827 length:600 start_codon:yes stop_codon:yes gene_type:complete
MRLSGLGPSPSLFIQRRGQNNGQVSDVNKNQENPVENEDLNTDANTKEDPLEDSKVRAQVAELQQVEDKVIAHEQAHMAAGGEFTGGASYGYTVGPDGKRYITSGEVSISIPSGGNPESTLHALERVKAAALAPSDPSGQDQKVAASASAKMMSIRSEIAKQKASEAYGKDKDWLVAKDPELQHAHAHESDREHIHLAV